ncbi:13608_t:CDS:2 [Cetraspora pellucida]|uniref:13608_t:CDS:1 n=1 Tax=Cetraspora pellucida TaxID=1433469 RepID=A0A9N9FJ83_9GLOM|nr:13608_t:CDS:2 [Cetraspora pellucida]
MTTNRRDTGRHAYLSNCKLDKCLITSLVTKYLGVAKGKPVIAEPAKPEITGFRLAALNIKKWILRKKGNNIP